MSPAGRPFTSADYLGLKAATRRACEQAGLHKTAAHTRVDPALLSRYGNPEATCFAPIDVAMDLDALAGSHEILEAWADRCGFSLVPLDAEARADRGRLADHTPTLLKEFSDVVNELSQASARRTDTPAGAMRLLDELAELKAVINAAEDHCRAVAARIGES
jgi:hypothetical protein